MLSNIIKDLTDQTKIDKNTLFLNLVQKRLDDAFTSYYKDINTYSDSIVY